LNYALGRQDALSAAYDAASAEVTMCLTTPDDCTVAGKSIKLSAQNNAL